MTMLDDDVTGQPVTGDSAEHLMRLIIKLGEDRNAGGIEPAAGQQPDEQLAVHLQAFGHRLQVLRASEPRRWSLRTFARRSGIDRGSLSRIEAGKNITLDVLWRLANTLEVHWADLLDDRISDIPTQREPASFELQLAAFGGRVSLIRVRHHVTLEEFAERTGTTRSTIFNIEGGTQNIRLDTLWRLATGLGVHWADLLDDRQPDSLRAQLRQAQNQVRQLRTRVTLAEARAAVAKPVGEHAAVRQINSAVAQARLVVDRYDRPLLAALSPKQVTAHVDGRRVLYDYLDRLWRDGQHQGLDQRPEWNSVEALRDLARYLMANALEAQMHRN